MRTIDLSHPIENGMPGFRMKAPDGTLIEYTAQVRPFLTHAQSRPYYDGQAEFEITELCLQTSIGTYLDAPYHRHADRRDISQIGLDEVILPGAVLDVRGRAPWEPVGLEAIPDELDLAGKAVLFNLGWDRYWGTEAYYAYPFLAPTMLRYLIDAGVKLVGVDALNIDDARDKTRPAHTWLLAQDILIVENLCRLDGLYGLDFTFLAVPLKVCGAAAMPVRAFAQVNGA